MEEKIITCVNCGNPFVFTVFDQKRFAASGFDMPRRCRDCRRKKARGGQSSHEDKKRNKRRQPRHEWEYIPDA